MWLLLSKLLYNRCKLLTRHIGWHSLESLWSQRVNNWTSLTLNPLRKHTVFGIKQLQFALEWWAFKKAKSKGNVITVTQSIFIFSLTHTSYTSLWLGTWVCSLPVQGLTTGCQIHSYLHCLTPTACLNVNYNETEVETWWGDFSEWAFFYCALFFTRVCHLSSQCPVISLIHLLVFPISNLFRF